MRLYHHLVQLLFPAKCVLCGRLLKNVETDLCRDCRVEAPYYRNTKRKPQFLDSFAAIWYYEGTARASVLRYKFRGRRSYAAAYGRFVAMALGRQERDYDLLTWIPISPQRRLARGYDQVELVARAAGRELGQAPVSTLKKIRNNRPQSGIVGEAARRANVLGVYRARDVDLSGKRVVLLDDILTTGATASEAARVLKTAGAAEVHVVVVAAAGKD